ncbi:MAG: 2OG-Fe(II) oxygenase [Deltaproteobacteria bacterium]
MKQQDFVRRLSQGIASAIRAAKFCVSGVLPPIDPGLDVAGVGAVGLPLTPAAAKRLKSVCKQAPYGQGTRTLVDTRVRNAYELGPTRFSLTSPHWDEAIREALASVAEQLGLPADQLQARLYKLLFYQPGGFFKPHRDSEKNDRMVGSLIVALPTHFDGGSLTVRHQGISQHVDFKEAAAGRAPSYAAFYADCEHEVAHVSYGNRLCLAYNLVLRAPARKKQPSPSIRNGGPVKTLADSISSWVAKEKAEPLVFALDHHYTQRGLSRDLLKGNDRAMSDLVVAAAEQAGCRAYFCQVERHVCQDACSGDWDDRWRYSTAVPDRLELGDIYLDDLAGTDWFDVSGKRQPFPEIGFSRASIIASTPIDEWQPTREEYEGYTGNAGNTLDRWYHRSALCVWHRDRHFDVIAGGGVESAVEMLAGLVAKLNRTARRRLDEARGDCLRLARAIIGRWPQSYFGEPRRGRNDSLAAFPRLLAQLADPKIIGEFLQSAAPKDRGLDLAQFVVAACRKHGCETFAGALTALFQANGEGVRVCDMNWLDQLACARLDDPGKDALVAKLAKLAAAQFCRPLPAGHFDGDDPARPERTLPQIVRVLLVSGDMATLDEVIRFVRSQPRRFSAEKTQVPGLEQTVGWLRKQNAAAPPAITQWLRALERELSAATEREPRPPTDWARPAEIACQCEFCRQLNALLADPNAATGRVPARADARDHLTREAARHKCDVTCKLERRGSPYALVFTKTTGSFERRKKRYAADRKLLQTVRSLVRQPVR